DSSNQRLLEAPNLGQLSSLKDIGRYDKFECGSRAEGTLQSIRNWREVALRFGLHLHVALKRFDTGVLKRIKLTTNRECKLNWVRVPFVFRPAESAAMRVRVFFESANDGLAEHALIEFEQVLLLIGSWRLLRLGQGRVWDCGRISRQLMRGLDDGGERPYCD